MNQKAAADVRAEAGIVRAGDGDLGVRVASFWDVECYRKKKLVWEEHVKNLVVLDGLNRLLLACFMPPNGAITWYVGLIDNNSFTGFNFNDNMGSHAGWFESVAYSEPTRAQYVPGPTVANGYVDNAGSRASFTITIAHIVRGGFLTSGNGKTGTTGALYGEAQFASPRSVDVSDVIVVKLACQITSS